MKLSRLESNTVEHIFPSVKSVKNRQFVLSWSKFSRFWSRQLKQSMLEANTIELSSFQSSQPKYIIALCRIDRYLRGIDQYAIQSKTVSHKLFRSSRWLSIFVQSRNFRRSSQSKHNNFGSNCLKSSTFVSTTGSQHESFRLRIIDLFLGGSKLSRLRQK